MEQFKHFEKKSSPLASVDSALFFFLILIGISVIAILFSPHHRLYQVDVETGFIKLHLSDSIQNIFEHFKDSTIFDLPQPFGPTIPVNPSSIRKLVFSAKDLNPLSWIFLNSIH